MTEAGRLLDALRAAKLVDSPEEVADALWLVRWMLQQAATAGSRGEPSAPRRVSPHEPPPEQLRPAKPDEKGKRPAPPTPGPQPAPAVEQPGPVSIHLPRPTSVAGGV